MKTAESTEMAKIAQELRDFVADLQARPDIRVSVARFGDKAAPSDVDLARSLFEELGDFCAEMNGIHVEWEFVGWPGQGCMRIPPVGSWTKFTGEDVLFMGFGEGTEALLLDDIRAEGSTWIVREKDNNETARFVFAAPAEGADGVDLGVSLADYMRKAMANGFVHYWPMCFLNNPDVSYLEQEVSIDCFHGRPTE